MTLILTVVGPETIWLIADRRLRTPARVLRDDAQKILLLGARDGTAILGYSGLGSTAGAGTQPADWMSSVLRGRNLTVEQSLMVLAGAARRQLPRHLARFPPELRWHTTLAAAIVDNEPRLYSLEVRCSPERRAYGTRNLRHQVRLPNVDRLFTLRIFSTGSGVQALEMNRDAWRRELLSLVAACDRRRVSHEAVTQYLARLCQRAHRETADGSVGPRSIVVWRNRQGAHNGGGGELHFANGAIDHSPAGPRFLPTIAMGNDIRALIETAEAYLVRTLQAAPPVVGTVLPEADIDAMNADLDRLPQDSDENLR